MKARLLFSARDIHLDQELPPHAEMLIQDLGLDPLLDAMGAGDDFLRDVAARNLLNGVDDPEAIRYRQAILADCIQSPAVVRELYGFAVAVLKAKQEARIFWFHESPDSQLGKGVRFLELLHDLLRQLRTFADQHEATFRSEGLRTLLQTLRDELDDDYLDLVASSVRELNFKRGPLISAQVGRASRGTNYVLRKPYAKTFLQRMTPGGPPSYSFRLAPRDEAGHQALGEIRGKGIRRASAAAAEAADHILSFFIMLRAELGFYLACLNLQERLAAKEEPTCFPTPQSATNRAFSAKQLYDPSLTLHLEDRVVGNDCNANGCTLVVITGANQGGKSTFLRSVGIAQLMMQSGMFVAADEFTASVSSGVFTHFKREEDKSMTHGKLDEELARMSELATHFQPTSLLLANESFASTTESEGSEIARQLVRALREAGMRTFFVTHLYDLAHGWYEEQRNDTLFLRAERSSDGSRPFRLSEEEPLPTSYGADTYREVFGHELASAGATAAAEHLADQAEPA